MGAAAFTGVPRLVYLFGQDPENEDPYCHVMKELRDKSFAMQYKTVAVPDPKGIQTSPIVGIEWGSRVTVDADELAGNQKAQEKSITARAVMLVKGMLRTGEKRKADLDSALKENGIDPEKLEWTRIKKRCKAEARPLPGKGTGWVWHLTTATCNQAEFDKEN
jgi:hypothetical protein